MILITGATGKTGKAILRKLSEKDGRVKALVHRPEQIQEVEALGAAEIVVGDIREASIIHKVIQGVDSVYHICPNMHPDEIVIGKIMIKASSTTGIGHFVYHSVLHPQIEALPHHWKKMRVEESLVESGLPFTILQPAVYMQNILANWKNIVEKGKYTVPYAVESRISMVDLEDVAQSAVTVLTKVSPQTNRPLHLGATYELVGTPAMTQIEVAAILSEQLARPVTVESESRETWELRVRNSGLGDYQVITLLKMFEYYEEHGFWGSSQVLNWLIDRPPTNFETFVKRIVEER